MARRKGGGGATEKGNEREKQAGTEVDFFYTMVELVVEMVVMVMLVMVVVQVDFCSDNGGDDSDRT